MRSVVKEWCEEYHDKAEHDGADCQLGCSELVERVALEAKLETVRQITKYDHCHECVAVAAWREQRNVEKLLEAVGFTSPTAGA